MVRPTPFTQMGAKCPYLTPKPLVMATPTLACKWIFTKIGEKNWFWVDDVIIETSKLHFQKIAPFFNDLVGGSCVIAKFIFDF